MSSPPQQQDRECHAHRGPHVEHAAAADLGRILRMDDVAQVGARHRPGPRRRTRASSASLSVDRGGDAVGLDAQAPQLCRTTRSRSASTPARMPRSDPLAGRRRRGRRAAATPARDRRSTSGRRRRLPQIARSRGQRLHHPPRWRRRHRGRRTRSGRSTTASGGRRAPTSVQRGHARRQPVLVSRPNRPGVADHPGDVVIDRDRCPGIGLSRPDGHAVPASVVDERDRGDRSRRPDTSSAPWPRVVVQNRRTAAAVDLTRPGQPGAGRTAGISPGPGRKSACEPAPAKMTGWSPSRWMRGSSQRRRRSAPTSSWAARASQTGVVEPSSCSSRNHESTAPSLPRGRSRRRTTSASRSWRRRRGTGRPSSRRGAPRARSR